MTRFSPEDLSLKKSVVKELESIVFEIDHENVYRITDITATEIAERAADMFNCYSWLDDETHWIWDEAVIALERYYK